MYDVTVPTRSTMKISGNSIPIMRAMLVHQLFKLLVFRRSPVASGTHRLSRDWIGENI